MQVISKHLKIALMSYFRFKKQCVCADEVSGVVRGHADILVDTQSEIIEVEVKVSRSDLSNESKKPKHQRIKEIEINKNYSNWTPNRFYLCVPKNLEEDAKIWIQQINFKYGLLIYREGYPWEDRILCVRKAQLLKESYNKGAFNIIVRRLCSSVINAYINLTK